RVDTRRPDIGVRLERDVALVAADVRRVARAVSLTPLVVEALAGHGIQRDGRATRADRSVATGFRTATGGDEDTERKRPTHHDTMIQHGYTPLAVSSSELGH